MISNSNFENLINRNIKTDIFSMINDNSFNNKNPTQSKSSEYILTNKQEDKDNIQNQKLILSTNSEKNNGDINQRENTKSNDKKKTKKQLYNILVAVRCRPLSKKEKEISTKETIKIIDDKTLTLKDPYGFLNPNNVRGKEKSMNFDFVFGPLIGQEKIFNSTTKFLLDKVVNGFNATVFAYGVTGAGKTYTMLGNDENPGIMVWAFRDLYQKINECKSREYLIKLWYVEIYNENIRDLLNNKNENLELREDPDEGVIINNVTEIITNSMNEILILLKKGNRNRTVEETDANKTSSRSHAILQIKVSFKEKNNGNSNNNLVKFGKLNLIDLAGSERAGATKNRGLRLIEGANINKSLLTLGNCINALVEKNQRGSKIYVPYRDSKLTRLLKDSLSGNSRTVMIANISPFIYNFDDTYNTLKYAERAKCIKTNVRVNIADNNKSNDFMQLIKNLNNKIHQLGNQLNIKIQNNNMNKRTNSINYKKNYSSNKMKRNTYDFRENTFSDNDIKMKIKSEKENIKDIKKQNTRMIKSSDKYKENKSSNDFIDELVLEKDKKISLIIEDYIQQSEAEIQLKKKIIKIQYNLILLYNKIEKNLSFKNNNSEDKVRLKNMKKMLEKNIENLNEMNERNDNFIKKYIQNNNEENNEDDVEFNPLQKKYIYIIYQNTKIQKENIEVQFRYSIMKNEYEKKDNYIKELEKQIKLRDYIIKELLFFDNIKKNDKNKEKNDINNVISNILKKEKNIKYISISQMQKQNNSVNIKNGRNTEKEINIYRPNTLFGLSENKLDNYFYQNTNSTNKEFILEKDNYIIDFDKEKSQVSNSYMSLNIPTLIKSNSSFNINKYDKKISNKFINNSNNMKLEIESEKNLLNYPLDKNAEIEKNNKEENSKNIKLILSKIKNMNNEISSKMSIIEQQSSRNKKLIGISGQFINKVHNKNNTAAFINNINKEDNIIELNKNNLKINMTKEKHNINKKLLENLNKENNDTIYNINLQVNKQKITNRKSKDKKIKSSTKLLRSEGNKNGNPKILNKDRTEQNLIFRKIDLSKGKSTNKNKNKNYRKANYSKSKNELIQNQSFINAFNQDTIKNKKRFEKNKSALNIINIKNSKINSNKKQNEFNKNYNNNNKKINIKLVKDNIIHKKYNTIFISTNFNDKNPVIVQNKISVIDKRNKDKKNKIERFINIDK